VTPLASDFQAFQTGLAIKYAVRRKRMKVVKQAVAEFGINTRVYAGKTILDLAIERGSLRMVKMLVEANGRIRPDALIEAVRNNAINTVRFLLSRDTDVNYAISATGSTALMLAASGDAVEVATILLEAGADRTPKNRWGKTARELAHSSKMKKLLGRN
jgi:ankyrin repeat protein